MFLKYFSQRGGREKCHSLNAFDAFDEALEKFQNCYIKKWCRPSSIQSENLSDLIWYVLQMTKLKYSVLRVSFVFFT